MNSSFVEQFFAEIPAQLSDFEEKAKEFETFIQNLPNAEEEEEE